MGLQQHFHSRLGTKLRAKFRPIQPIAVFPVVLSEATPNATVTMETQRLFAADCNRRPAAMAAAISGDNYCVGWQEWVPFGVWLCEEYPLLLRSERMEAVVRLANSSCMYNRSIGLAGVIVL
jgi:hypothetical protein